MHTSSTAIGRSSGVSALVRMLDEAVALAEPGAVTEHVKTGLQRLIRDRSLQLAPRFYEPRPDTYARRLLHRDPVGRYTAVVMTWGPGQGTALHDHAGIWCVEGVLEGRMEVTQYDLIDEASETYRFEERGRVRAEVGSAGCLIPPFEYHTLANALPGTPAVTLHVYGGEMDRCHIFERLPDGLYRRVEKRLSYHD